ncbi:serpin-type proteinase inhibitor 8 [Vairimorpha necatrix]|uniref:Serpin-type proteinase inhibitor 8 n=1 Tax=Vairimorpha necatrix TaxID=6039 RepID=A0AAX4JGP4_9MICR
MYKLHDMMLDISDVIYDQMLQENTNTFVFSPFSVINFLWIYFNVYEKIAGDTCLDFDLKNFVQRKKSYNVEFTDINHQIRNIFDKTNWFLEQGHSEGFVYLNNFIFCKDESNLIFEIDQKITRSPNLIITEYQSSLKSEDLSKLISQTINSEVKWRLNKIPNVCRNNLNTKILNTVLYSSVWEIPFITELENENFYINKNKTVKITMMQKTDKMLKFETDDFIAVTLPLNIYCMNFIAVLPKNDKNLFDIHKSITGNNRNGLNDLMSKATEHFLTLTMPSFKVESVLNLVFKMKNESVKKIFKENNIDENFINFENVFINSQTDFEHIAMVDINDHGANDIELKMSSSSESDEFKEIQLNRPFLFYIVENIALDDELKRFSSVPIFMGRYSGENIE